jgi:hypothetical protein
LKALSGEVQVFILHCPPFLTAKKFSVPDISVIAKDFTDAKSEILNELFVVAICCFHGKYDGSIESVAIHP